VKEGELTAAKVLVVEDDPVTATVILESLDAFGYQTQEVCSNGSDAVERSSDTAPTSS
jgi:CheY-like chemotaxis protein